MLVLERASANVYFKKQAARMRHCAEPVSIYQEIL